MPDRRRYWRSKRKLNKKFHGESRKQKIILRSNNVPKKDKK